MEKPGRLKMEFDPKRGSCPLCNSQKIKHHLTDFRGINIDICSECTTQFMNPRYTSGYLDAFYSGYQSGDTSHHVYGGNEIPRKLLHKINISEIETYVKPGHFLSIGSGNCFDVMEANNRGWDAEGIDMDAQFIAQITKKYGIKMKSGDFLQQEYPKSHFACVYLNHVLEHPKEPGKYLEKTHSILQTGGILFIACPNIRSFSNIIKHLLEVSGIKKQRAKHYDTWQHLTYFNPKGLKMALEKNFAFDVLLMGNDMKIDHKTLKPKPNLFLFPYKSSFRMIVSKK
jgi:SAM-dependent methyltransferase